MNNIMTIKHPKKDTTGQGSKRNSSKKDTKKSSKKKFKCSGCGNSMDTDEFKDM